MLELILDVHLCYNIILMSLLKEAVEKAKLVFIRSRKYIWNNKIGEGGGEWSRAEHFYEGTHVQCWYLMKHPSSLIQSCRSL